MTLSLEEYQKFAYNQCSCVDRNIIEFALLGLVSEAGEAADLRRLSLVHSKYNPGEASAMLLELGDVLFYVALLAEIYDSSLEDILSKNVSKIKDRMAQNTLIKDTNYTRK